MCERYLKDFPEKEYKSYKKQFKPSVDFENSNNYFPQRRSNDQLFKPKNEGYNHNNNSNNNNFGQYRSVYDRPPTNQRRRESNNNNNEHRSGQCRYESTNHYSNVNVSQSNNRNILRISISN